MILSEMYTQLGKRLEDEGGSTFSNTDKRVAIIIAQRMCATILDEEYLLGLEVKKSNISVRLDPDYLGCQSFSLRENSIVPFANKITLIEAPSRTGSPVNRGYCRIVEADYIDQSANHYLSGDEVGELVANIHGDTVRIFSETGLAFSQGVHVSYIEDPYTLTNFNDQTNEIPLNHTLHPIVLDLAEGELWAKDRNYTRSMDAYKKGYAILTTLNQRKEYDGKDFH